ncbi:MAG: lysine--tRNA ligase [Dehalococcoidia bacterium]
MPDREDGLLSSRYSKLDHLRQSGIDPYPPRFVRTYDNAAATAMFEAVESDDTPETTTPSISLGGRIMSMRVMGRAAFLDIRDGSGTIQALLRENVLGDAYGLLKDLDLGDHLGMSGPVMRTHTGQVTIEAHELTITSKGMKPLPEKFHGLRDTETRYRQRYLDLIANPEVMPVFAIRSKIIERIRAFFQSQGFLEVDTPILVPVAGGAHARPFITHHNTLDQQLYLRIATELYLKRLIIGGFDKVYELGRVFRNEGIDQDHNPEFTLLESYQAYADYNDTMTMVESLVSTVAMEVLGTTHVQYGDQLIDFAPPWKRVDFRQELKDFSGVDIDAYTDDESLKHRAAELGLDIEPKDGRAKVIDKLFSSYVEPRLAQPTFVLDYPVIMSPLAKAKPDSPGYVERFEAFAAGMEIANSYTELNDPAVQRERFENQEALRLMLGDDETDRLDEDFLIALEDGMPPTGGLGMGIDRLVMLLAGQTSIRDIMLFPQMRTLQPGQEEESE